MGKKRKSIATSLDEVDRTMYSNFCGAANSLSQLYSQAMNQQKLSFQTGERHGLEKLYQWIWRQQEGGSRVNTADILTYIQNELEYCGEEPSMSPRAPHHHSQPAMPSFFSGSSGPTAIGQGTPVFSNALSSPVRRSLQNYSLAPSRNNEVPNPFPQQNTSNNDSSMDDSPGHESTY